jgi:hypothetical protein
VDGHILRHDVTEDPSLLAPPFFHGVKNAKNEGLPIDHNCPHMGSAVVVHRDEYVRVAKDTDPFHFLSKENHPYRKRSLLRDCIGLCRPHYDVSLILEELTRPNLDGVAQCGSVVKRGPHTFCAEALSRSTTGIAFLYNFASGDGVWSDYLSLKHGVSTISVTVPASQQIVDHFSRHVKDRSGGGQAMHIKLELGGDELEDLNKTLDVIESTGAASLDITFHPRMYEYGWVLKVLRRLRDMFDPIGRDFSDMDFRSDASTLVVSLIPRSWAVMVDA